MHQRDFHGRHGVFRNDVDDVKTDAENDNGVQRQCEKHGESHAIVLMTVIVPIQGGLHLVHLVSLVCINALAVINGLPVFD